MIMIMEDGSLKDARREGNGRWRPYTSVWVSE